MKAPKTNLRIVAPLVAGLLMVGCGKPQPLSDAETKLVGVWGAKLNGQVLEFDADRSGRIFQTFAIYEVGGYGDRCKWRIEGNELVLTLWDEEGTSSGDFRFRFSPAADGRKLNVERRDPFDESVYTKLPVRKSEEGEPLGSG